jgi:hypothetical protein
MVWNDARIVLDWPSALAKPRFDATRPQMTAVLVHRLLRRMKNENGY